MVAMEMGLAETTDEEGYAVVDGVRVGIGG